MFNAPGEPQQPERTNVVDLMAALKKSVGQRAEESLGLAGLQATAAKRNRVNRTLI